MTIKIMVHDIQRTHVRHNSIDCYKFKLYETKLLVVPDILYIHVYQYNMFTTITARLPVLSTSIDLKLMPWVVGNHRDHVELPKKTLLLLVLLVCVLSCGLNKEASSLPRFLSHWQGSHLRLESRNLSKTKVHHDVTSLSACRRRRIVAF